MGSHLHTSLNSTSVAKSCSTAQNEPVDTSCSQHMRKVGAAYWENFDLNLKLQMHHQKQKNLDTTGAGGGGGYGISVWQDRRSWWWDFPRRFSARSKIVRARLRKWVQSASECSLIREKPAEWSLGDLWMFSGCSLRALWAAADGCSLSAPQSVPRVCPEISPWNSPDIPLTPTWYPPDIFLILTWKWFS